MEQMIDDRVMALVERGRAKQAQIDADEAAEKEAAEEMFRKDWAELRAALAETLPEEIRPFVPEVIGIDTDGSVMMCDTRMNFYWMTVKIPGLSVIGISFSKRDGIWNVGMLNYGRLDARGYKVPGATVIDGEVAWDWRYIVQCTADLDMALAWAAESQVKYEQLKEELRERKERTEEEIQVEYVNEQYEQPAVGIKDLVVRDLVGLIRDVVREEIQL